jgi:hypothetical protein
MPDLHDLIRQYGGYVKIPPQAWRDYYEMMTAWKLDHGMGANDNYDHGNQVAFVPKTGRQDD